MDGKKLVWLTVLTAILLLVVGYLFVREVPSLSYTEAGILYMSGVIGAGLFWIGANLRK